MKVVILAGGKGTRLAPYTTSFPKPMVPVGDKPILERIIRDLVKYGFNEIIISVGHLAPLIQAYFGDGLKLGARIEYSLENTPLGTIGPLNLIKDKLYEPFFLINGDTLTDLDYSKMKEDFVDHIPDDVVASIAVNNRYIDIEFGVVEGIMPLRVGEVKRRIGKYIEKPRIQYQVGMGVCIFRPWVFKHIRDGKMDLPELLDVLIPMQRVMAYFHDGYWFDIGRPKDYESACAFVEGGVGWN